MSMRGSRRWRAAAGEIVLTARSFRTQEANRADARARLTEMVARAHVRPVRRVKTKPGKAAKERRLAGKAIRSDVKKGRGKQGLDV
jgi:ribosome-associated protein